MSQACIPVPIAAPNIIVYNLKQGQTKENLAGEPARYDPNKRYFVTCGDQLDACTGANVQQTSGEVGPFKTFDVVGTMCPGSRIELQKPGEDVDFVTYSVHCCAKQGNK